MDTKEINYLLGRATALVEKLTDMPHRVVPKIAAHPIEIVKRWLREATIKDSDELMEVMSKIDNIPASLTVVQQGDFWTGYYKQCKDNSFRDRLGRQLSAIRLTRGMSLNQVAELANTTETTISKIENGKWSVSIDMIEKVCRALNVDIILTDSATREEEIGKY